MRPNLPRSPAMRADGRSVCSVTRHQSQPLTRITDSIAGVIAADSGRLTAQQSESLRDAMAACDQMDAIVAGLRRLNRRREHGEVHRCWSPLSSLKIEAEQLLRHQLPRRDPLAWIRCRATRVRRPIDRQPIARRFDRFGDAARGFAAGGR